MIESNPCLFHNLSWKCIWFTPTLWETWLGHKTRLPIIRNYFVVNVFYFKLDLWDGGYRGHGNDWYGSGDGQMAGPYEHGNGVAGSIIAGILLTSWGTVGLCRRAVLCVVSRLVFNVLAHDKQLCCDVSVWNWSDKTNQTQDMVWHS